MKQSQSNHIGDTVRLRRPPRVFTDELGHNIWTDDVDTGRFEVLSEENIESMLEFGYRPQHSDRPAITRSGLNMVGDPRNTARRIDWPGRK